MSTGRSSIITLDDAYCLAFGFGITASGGGGSFMKGIDIVNQMATTFKPISLVNPCDIEAGKKAISAGGIGKPESLTDVQKFSGRLQKLLEVLHKYLQKHHGGDLAGIIPIEAGPLNGLLPLYSVSIMNNCIQNSQKEETPPNFCLFDCDGAGRSVPSMVNLLYDIELETTTPIAYNFYNTLAAGRNVVLEKLDEESHLLGKDAEQMFTNVMSQKTEDPDINNEILPFACWAFHMDNDKDAGNVKKEVNFPTGTYTYWKERGKEFREKYTSEKDLKDFLKALDEKNSGTADVYKHMIYNGQVNALQEVDNDRWDCGYIVFDEKVENNVKTEKRVYFVNENLALCEYSHSTGKLRNLATGPSIITTFFYDENPAKEIVIGVAASGKETPKLEKGFIPYNTGDMDKIRELCKAKAKILVNVSDPTIPGDNNKNYLFGNEMKKRFLSIMNDIFEELRQSSEDFVFPSKIEVPNPDWM